MYYRISRIIVFIQAFKILCILIIIYVYIRFVEFENYFQEIVSQSIYSGANSLGLIRGYSILPPSLMFSSALCADPLLDPLAEPSLGVRLGDVLYIPGYYCISAARAGSK